MYYTENHHLYVLSPELELINQNQNEENLNLNMQEAQLPPDFEMNAVIPLEGENLMYLPLKFDNDVKKKHWMTQEHVLTPCRPIFMKNKHRRIPSQIWSKLHF